MTRKLLFVVFAVVGLAGLRPVTGLAADPPPVWNTDEAGVAIGGYDPVAYFEEGAATMGDPAVALEWNGATWQFATEAHRDAFAAEPARYAPAYGGYCAYAMAKGAVAPTDPEDGWTVFENRLYLNYSADVRERWRQSIPRYIDEANSNWPSISADLAAP